jgi:hypothetical protein
MVAEAFGQPLSPGGFAAGIECGIAGQAVQPGSPAGGVAQLAGPLPDSRPDLLANVVHPMGIAQHGKHHAPHPAFLTAQKLSERARVTLLDGLDHRLVRVEISPRRHLPHHLHRRTPGSQPVNAGG